LQKESIQQRQKLNFKVSKESNKKVQNPPPTQTILAIDVTNFHDFDD
jgi:hypothetical protein